MGELERLLDGRERQDPPPSLGAIWPQLKRWATTPVTDATGNDADLMLYETALSLEPPSRHQSPPHFWIGITRQFAPEDQEVEGICIALEYEPDDELAATVTMHGPHNGYGAQTWGISSTNELRDFDHTPDPGASPASWSTSVEHDRAFAILRNRTPRRLTIEHGGG